MSATRPTGGRALVKLRLSGLVFLVVLAALVGLTVALYQKTFTPVVAVTLEADRVGNQLSAPTDVKLRGLIVGEVRSVAAAPNGATLQLALDPTKVSLIPNNVQAQLLPKTLFGEKFVSLVVPAAPSGQPIQAGDVIPQDRSQTARETETALNDLLPLLQTLKPEQVSLTLNALSAALRGRGDRIGANGVLVRDYLVRFNPQLPVLEQDFRGLADFADTLNAATPDIVRVLDNLSFINRSLVDQQRQLDGFLRSTTDVSGRFDSFLRQNETRLVTLAADSQPTLDVYARYSPEFPCLANGLTKSQRIIGNAFGGLQPGLHITLQVTKDQGGYVPGDQPAYKEDRGPGCFGLPTPVPPAKDINLQDGYYDNGPPNSSQRPAPGAAPAGAPPAGAAANPAAFLAGPTGQRMLINAAVAPVMGMAPGDVPDLALLLFGPLARGTTVGLSSGSAS